MERKYFPKLDKKLSIASICSRHLFSAMKFAGGQKKSLVDGLALKSTMTVFVTCGLDILEP